jgi:hypothetical protein
MKDLLTFWHSLSLLLLTPYIQPCPPPANAINTYCLYTATSTTDRYSAVRTFRLVTFYPPSTHLPSPHSPYHLGPAPPPHHLAGHLRQSRQPAYAPLPTVLLIPHIHLGPFEAELPNPHTVFTTSTSFVISVFVSLSRDYRLDYKTILGHACADYGGDPASRSGRYKRGQCERKRYDCRGRAGGYG